MSETKKEMESLQEVQQRQGRVIFVVCCIWVIFLVAYAVSNTITEVDAEELASNWVIKQGLVPGPAQCFETTSRLWKRCEVTVRRPDTSLELHNLNCGYFGPVRVPWEPLTCYEVQDRWVPAE